MPKILTPLTLLSSLALAAASQAQVSFSFDFGREVSPQWQATFQKAADIWSSTLSGGSTGAPVALRYKVDTAPLGLNAGGKPKLGGADSAADNVSYSAFRNGLAANPNKSALDTTALSRLETGPNYTVEANDVKVKTDADGNTIFDDEGRGVPDLDRNGNFQYTPSYTFHSGTMLMTTANQKALGMVPDYDPYYQDASGHGYDALITFASLSDVSGSHLDWDFDPSDGIGSNGGLAYDALGTVLHEIGHSLGFYSMVDIRDQYIGYTPEENDYETSALDMFRYELVDGQWVRSVQIGPRDERFSVDGQNVGERFSMGEYEGGKGWQASHWYEDNTDSDLTPTGYGLMKPVSYKDRPNVFGGDDLAAFDAIGWNLNPVPEPGSLAALGLGALALLRRKRR